MNAECNVREQLDESLSGAERHYIAKGWSSSAPNHHLDTAVQTF
jgi:hypothetical protein